MNAIPVLNLFTQPQCSQFDPNDWNILAQHWYPVVQIQDVTTQPQQVQLLDVKMAIYKTESGEIHLVRDICPHRGVPLSKGWVEGENIVCPYHGLNYNAQGKCVKIPAQPELTQISDRFTLTKFPVVPKYETERTDYGLKTIYISTVSNFPHSLRHLEPEKFLWKREFDVYPPFSATLTVYFPNNGILKILNACCPVSHNQTRLFVPLTRNFDTTGDLQAVYDFNAQIFAEDQDIVESQKPEELPLDVSMEAHFAADKSSTTYRRILAEWGLSKRYVV